MKYLKKFEDHTAYETYINGSDVALPNVSLCVQEDEVYYNPYVEPFFCKLTLNDDSVVEIEGSGALTYNHTKLYSASTVSVELGTLCTSIGDTALSQYPLRSITLSNTVTSIGYSSFNQCSLLLTIDIPNSVTSIGKMAFAFCTKLKNPIIGSGITSIGDNAFWTTMYIDSITIKATTPPTLVGTPFHPEDPAPIYVPAESVDAYKAASGWSNYASRIQAIPTT